MFHLVFADKFYERWWNVKSLGGRDDYLYIIVIYEILASDRDIFQSVLSVLPNAWKPVDNCKIYHLRY